MTNMEFCVLVRPIEISRTTTEFYAVEPYNLGPAPRCSRCAEFVGMMQWLAPFRAEMEQLGDQLGDVAFSSTPELLVSDKFQGAYTRAGLTGFQGFEVVEIVSVKNRKKSTIDLPPRYYHVRPCIGTGVIDDKASGLVRSERGRCLECHAGGTIVRFERIVLEAGTWSGEDVFFARGLPGSILVSSRFVEVCRANQIKNAVFIPAVNYHRSIDE